MLKKKSKTKKQMENNTKKINYKKSFKKISKSDKYDSSITIMGDELDNVEKRYCSCLMKVRSKKIPEPYGICTSAVYKKSVRDKVVKCSEHYDFEKYNLKTLRLYAKEKKIKGYSKMKKKELLKILKQYQKNKILSLKNKK